MYINIFIFIRFIQKSAFITTIQPCFNTEKIVNTRKRYNTKAALSFYPFATKY